MEQIIRRILKEQLEKKELKSSIDDYSKYGSDTLSVANKFQGGGYNWGGGSSGVCVPLIHNGKIVREKGKGTYCCGFTLSVAFIVATNKGLLKDKSFSEIKKFSSDWYGSGGKNGKLCVNAITNLGIGSEVPLSEAKPGDFVQLWRTNGSGHSVIFLDFWRDGNDNIIGIKYRSSQSSTKGIGDGKEIFAIKDKKGKTIRGGIDKNYTYAARIM